MAKIRELALFAGAGGGILGGQILGWETVCAVESDPYAASVLCARQNDGLLPPFPIWCGDIRDFDGKPWAGSTDVVSGGWPCTDISAAGKGAGIEGKESGLWAEMARIIGEVRPREVYVENSPMLVSRGLGRVCGDLAALGFDAEWGVVGAHHAGAPHKRDRIWVLARHPGAVADPQDDYGRPRKRGAKAGTRPEGERGRRPTSGRTPLADPHHPGRVEQWRGESIGAQQPAPECSSWWETEPELGRLADGVAHRVDRLRCLGNGQVPQAMALAYRTLSARLDKNHALGLNQTGRLEPHLECRQGHSQGDRRIDTTE